MADGNTIEQILSALREALPPNLAADGERNLRAALRSVFERLDLVTREEFEVQAAVLARTRAKLTELEKLVADMERRNRQS